MSRVPARSAIAGGGPERPRPSTVGRARPDLAIETEAPPGVRLAVGGAQLCLSDALDVYRTWPAPTAIVSDGAYGVLGFDGDTADHVDLPAWYEPHVAAWARAAKPDTTLWFWNSEIGWAAVHPVLERHGWRYAGCNVWNKGVGHIAGNVDTGRIRRFPVVTELCVHYVRNPVAAGTPLKAWLLAEWRRTGLPLRRANEACGVKDAAVRKWLNQSHLWYPPPPEAMERLAAYANEHGDPGGRPYFALDGQTPVRAETWARQRAHFACPHGVTNVWDREPMRGPERVKTPGGKAVHLNQKPLDLLARLVEASTRPGDVVWEPFGGLFGASLAASRLGRQAFAAELCPVYFRYGSERFVSGSSSTLGAGAGE